jgi:hypothetical protein
MLDGSLMPPPPGDLLTRLSIWVALIAYAIGAGLLLEARREPGLRRRARWAWAFGCVFFLSHVACAFAFFHHWSHAAAYRETARQTAELTGWNWGGGIYFNYVVAAGWVTDVLWWWLAPASFDRRPLWLTGLWQGFLFFMVFNGAVVFGHGPVRALGIVITILLAFLLWRRGKTAKLNTEAPHSP